MSKCLGTKTSQRLRLVSAYGCRSRGCWVLLLSWDMTTGRFVWYVLSTNLQKSNALASGILSGRLFLAWHFVRESFFHVAFCPVALCPGFIGCMLFVQESSNFDTCCYSVDGDITNSMETVLSIGSVIATPSLATAGIRHSWWWIPNRSIHVTLNTVLLPVTSEHFATFECNLFKLLN